MNVELVARKGGKGKWTLNYTGFQCFINSLSYSVEYKTSGFSTLFIIFALFLKIPDYLQFVLLPIVINVTKFNAYSFYKKVNFPKYFLLFYRYGKLLARYPFQAIFITLGKVFFE